MGACNEDYCEAQPNRMCLGCLLCLSDIELTALARFLEENQEGLHAAGLSLNAIEIILDAVSE
ncbi:hypothetical protein K9F62_10440 [Desulfovibrio sp. JY]|nr:hypothetical protein K9F62_10440 [Desulfovibrio sp. JY]